MAAATKPRKKSALRRKPRKRSGYTNIDISALAGFAKIVDGLVGIKNIMNLDLDAMGTKLQTSILNPTADGGLVDDAISAGKVTMSLKGVNWLQKQFSGRNVGMTLGRVRIHL